VHRHQWHSVIVAAAGANGRGHAGHAGVIGMAGLAHCAVMWFSICIHISLGPVAPAHLPVALSWLGGCPITPYVWVLAV
jgi:hypothetical protein